MLVTARTGRKDEVTCMTSDIVFHARAARVTCAWDCNTVNTCTWSVRPGTILWDYYSIILHIIIVFFYTLL